LPPLTTANEFCLGRCSDVDLLGFDQDNAPRLNFGGDIAKSSREGFSGTLWRRAAMGGRVLRRCNVARHGFEKDGNRLGLGRWGRLGGYDGGGDGLAVAWASVFGIAATMARTAGHLDWRKDWYWRTMVVRWC